MKASTANGASRGPPEPPPRDEAPPWWGAEMASDEPLPPRRDAGLKGRPALISTDAAWDEATIPARPYVVEGLSIRRTVTIIGGSAGAGKSSLLCASAIAACLGVPYGRMRPAKPLRVVVFNTEDDDVEQQRRFSAALRQFDRTPADLAGRIMRIGPKDSGTLVEHDLRTGRLQTTQAWDELNDLCSAWKPDLVVLDPLVELHTASENDNGAMRHVVALFRSFASRHDCGVVLVHHTRKGGEAGDLDAFRGASSVVGAGRSALTVVPMTEDEAVRFGLSRDTRRQFFRVDRPKANYGPTSGADWYELQSYELDNHEHVAAAIPWTPPGSAQAARTPPLDALALVSAEAARGSASGPYSPRLSLEQPRSIATVMAGKGITTPAEQKQALAWLTTEAKFVVAEWRDQDGDKRRGLRSPEGAPEAKWLEGSGM